MRGAYRFILLSFVTLACNEVFGLEPGRGHDAGGGGSSAAEPAGEGGTNASGGTNPDTGGSGGAVSCSSTADCVEAGLAWPPYLCLDRVCVDILEDECDTAIGAEWLDEHPEDQPLVLGALTHALHDEDPQYFSLELAMREFAAYGRIPIDGVERRPLLLVCQGDHDEDPTPLQRSLDHLIDTVGVSAMLLIPSGMDAYEAVGYAINTRLADVFFLDVGGDTSGFAGQVGGRLWSMLGDAQHIALPFASLVQLAEEHVNPSDSLGRRARLTRLVVIPPAEERGFESGVVAFLGPNVGTNGRISAGYPDTYLSVSPANPEIDVAKEVAAFAPDIVLDFTGRFENDIDEAMRDRSAPPPFYILPPSQARSGFLQQQIASDPSLRTRVVGLNDAGADDKTLYNAYLERFEATAPAAVDGSGSANVYDAVYFLLYSVMAGGTGGKNTGSGMQQLLVGPRRDIGPAHIDSVIDLLARGETLSLYGALGPPNFIPETGGRDKWANVWCIDEGLEYVMDALHFGVQSGFSEPLPCFDF